MKTRNIIAITLGAVAVIAVAAVVTLACITVRPTSYAGGWLEREAVKNIEIYHSSVEGSLIHSGGTDSVLVGNGELASEGYTADDLMSAMDFQLISACLQFNYSFGLSLADEEHVKNNEVTGEEIKTAYNELTTGVKLGYSFVITLNETRTLELTDDHDRKCTQEYNAVMFTVNEYSDWVRNIEAYAFVIDAPDSDVPGEDAASQTYYKLKFGMRTAEMLDILEGVYGYDPFPEEAEEEEDTEDDTEDDTTEGTTGEETE